MEIIIIEPSKGSLVLTILNLVLIELIKKIKSLVKNGNGKKVFFSLWY